jgi:hypothetical protein
MDSKEGAELVAATPTRSLRKAKIKLLCAFTNTNKESHSSLPKFVRSLDNLFLGITAKALRTSDRKGNSRNDAGISLVVYHCICSLRQTR